MKSSQKLGLMDIVGFFYDGIANRGFLKQGNNFSAINVPGAYSTYGSYEVHSQI
ncbi:hypothetical protein [Nostoc sp.]